MFVDECHLIWCDICGYVWAKKNQRAVMPIVNDKERQTYFGALDIKTQQFIVKPYPAGNGEFTVDFIKYLQSQSPKQRLVLIWDGASYHGGEVMQHYLQKLNAELTQAQWLVTCFKLAPNAPEQNPVEDAWLKLKSYIRQHYYLTHSFSSVKTLFFQAVQHLSFNFQKLNSYIDHLQLI